MYTHHVLANRSRTPSLSNSLDSVSSRSSPNPSEGDLPRHPLTNEPVQTPGPVAFSSPFAPQPLQMPAHFITKFVRGCFAAELGEVDFTQALKAMDYLKVFDDRRKREFCASLRRLNIDTNIFDYEKASIQKENPEMYDWISSIEDKSRRVEALYTQVYIGLRRWTLINEMRLMPFNKGNCTAMLDTLYPTHYAAPPTSQLTETILNSQRNAFRRYIEAVEANGRNVLRTLEHQSRRTGEANGWPVVRDIVDKYLRQSSDLTEQCIKIRDASDFPPTPQPSIRVDSGVSFQEPTKPASLETPRPSTRPSMPSRVQSSPAQDKAIPSIELDRPRPERKGSAFGRLARVFKSRSVDGRDDEHARSSSGRRSASGRRSTSAVREPHPKSSAQHSRENSADRAGTSAGPTGPSGLGPAGFGYSNAGGQGYGYGQGPTGFGPAGLGIVAIDDAHRERLIREARRAKELREMERRPSPTHFKLGEERRGVGKGKTFEPSALPGGYEALNAGYYRLEGYGKGAKEEEERPETRRREMPRVWAEEGVRGRYQNPYQAPLEELVIAELE